MLIVPTSEQEMNFRLSSKQNLKSTMPTRPPPSPTKKWLFALREGVRKQINAEMCEMLWREIKKKKKTGLRNIDLAGR